MRSSNLLHFSQRITSIELILHGAPLFQLVDYWAGLGFAFFSELHFWSAGLCCVLKQTTTLIYSCKHQKCIGKHCHMEETEI